jgi:phage tail-like protein
MSCGGAYQTFRLLDAFVGWEVSSDVLDHQNLAGLDEEAGVHLEQEKPGELSALDLLTYLPPPRLARGCGACDWYLVTPVPPQARLLHLDLCSCEWSSVWGGRCVPDGLVEPVAVAAWERRVAISDRGARMVWVWSRRGEQLSAAIRVAHPGPLAFTPRGELLVVSRGEKQDSVRRFGPVGEARGELPPLPEGHVDRIAVSRDGAVWLVVELDGALRLWRFKHEEKRCEARLLDDDEAEEFKPATVEELREAFPETGLTAASAYGFCLKQRGTDGLPVVCCYSWYGRGVDESEIAKPPQPARHKMGHLLTQAIDSGIPRCRWHRIQLDADVPQGTTLSIAVSTSEEDLSKDPQKAQGDKKQEGAWKDFPAGVPHHLDWTQSPTGSQDFLILQPPGRYLYLRMRLTGDGTATPLVRRIRLDFPRSTSMEELPAVYHQSPEAEKFTERFLSLFDASIAELDRAIERYPALLDPTSVPEEVLPWIGSFLDVGFDRAWVTEKRRKILSAVPELYRRRGTILGLTQAIKLVFDVEPTIQELANERMWGALGREGTRLGAVHLFGKARARFRLGSSALSKTPLRSFGKPDDDPLSAQAFRFRVLVPPNAQATKLWRERLQRLVESQKPAHTIASLRVGGSGFVLGTWSAVGVDTAFSSLAPPVLGKQGNVRLRRMSVLWSGPRGRPVGVSTTGAVVGSQTVME